MADHPDAAPSGDDVRVRILDAAVRLINRDGVHAATVSAISAEAGVAEAMLQARFGTANDVLVEIARFMTAAFGTAINATMVGGLSLHDSIRDAQRSFLDVVHAHRETERALVAIRVAAVDDPRIGVPAGSATTLHDELMLNGELWLSETARLHRIAWELPPRLLATFVSASLTGIAMEYLAGQDLEVSRQLVDLVAGDLARHGRPLAADSYSSG